jgi:hypothetical protein
MRFRFLAHSFVIVFSRTLTFASAFTLLVALGQAQIRFNKPDFDTGKGPVAVQQADFNGDGLADIVTANALGNSISVLLNMGNGTFVAHADYPTGKNPRALVVADFNNDGSPDVAVANQDDNTVSIFLANPDGTLRPFTTIPVGRQPDALVAADFNRDGKMDFAVANKGDSTLSIYLGDGKGNFKHGADYDAGDNLSQFNFPDSIVAADLNNDGVADLAVTNGSNNVSILLGNGDGTFRSAAGFSVLPAIPSAGAGPLLAVDLNQDGRMDLVVEFEECMDRSCDNGNIIFAGRGDGSFDQGHPIYADGWPAPIIAGDFNGDHALDLATNIAVVLIDPATVFTKPLFSLPISPAGLWVTSIAAADFDGDGKLDIVTANFGDDTVSLLQGNGDGTFHQSLRNGLPGLSQRILSQDFNRDGIADLIIDQFGFNGGLWLYLGNGDGTFKPPVKIVSDMSFLEIAAGDLNRDGIPDLVIAGFKSTPGWPVIIRVLLGKGDGTFREPIDIPAHFTATIDSISVIDLNGDGVPDLAILAPNSSPDSNSNSDLLSIYLGNGDGIFRAPVNTPIGPYSQGLVFGDFNGDGILDVAVGHRALGGSNEVSVFLGNHDGSFRPGANYSVEGNVTSLAAADLDHDGMLDLVVGHGHSVAVFHGYGNGAFRQEADMPGYEDVYQVRVADLDGDGLPDIVVADSQRLSLFLNNGDGSFQPRLDFSVGGAFAITINDFNSDGHPDIAVIGGFLSNSWSLLLSGDPPAPARDFKFTLGAASASVKAGQFTALTASVAAIGAFRDTVSLSCVGLPAGAACSFTPSSLTASSAPATSALIITTKASSSAALLPAQHGATLFAFGLPTLGIMVAGFSTRKRYKIAITLSLALLLGMLLLLPGCGIGKSAASAPVAATINGAGGPAPTGGSNGASAGSYTVTMVATSGGEPVITHSQPITLTVQ